MQAFKEMSVGHPKPRPTGDGSLDTKGAAVQDWRNGKILSFRLAEISARFRWAEMLLWSLWAKQPAVLVFPALRLNLCREHVAQLREHEQAFRDKGAALAAVD